jgi:hypothetical protein
MKTSLTRYDPEPRIVLKTLRQLIKTQGEACWMDQSALAYITYQELITETHWPTYHLSLSRRGIDYVHENAEDESS